MATSGPVICVEGLSKRYQVGRLHGQATFAESVTGMVRSPRGWVRARRAGDDHLWALRDVSFDVGAGEVVGFVGRNGAGKSTLLKVLSRITEPTSGRARIYGRVGSLIEVGTGFHPELTGRENIYLNGSMLGMSRREIAKSFDEIVEFSEVSAFIDTPVKRYSSGMYVRLAFAVAAHLLPEILVIDEVLSVGDAAFVRKCLSRLGDVAHTGRTVLFVSHNMVTVQRLCTTAILLEKGRLMEQGSPASVTARYLAGLTSTSLEWEKDVSENPGRAYFERLRLIDSTGGVPKTITSASSLSVEMEFVLARDYPGLTLVLSFDDEGGETIFASVPEDGQAWSPEEAGSYRAVMHLPDDILLGRTYGVRVGLIDPGGEVVEVIDHLRFSVEEVASFSTAPPMGRAGEIALRCKWGVTGGHAGR